jgi:hypothetical protein
VFSRNSLSSLGSNDAAATRNTFYHATTHPSQSLQDLQSSPQVNQASPYPQTAESCPHEHYCIICKKCYDDRNGLKRHRKEECERPGYWLCLHCPSNRWTTFKRLEMLKHHHSKEHEAVAGLDIEDAEQEFPKQKAWGCPCCVACFYNLEDWRDHEKAHGQNVMCHDKNGDTKIVGWEWNTLVASLIFGSEHLRDAATAFNWGNYTCSRREDVLAAVKFVLERHELPPEIARNYTISPMTAPEDCVWYAYQMCTTGQCDIQQLPSSRTHYISLSPRATTHLSRGSIDTSSDESHLQGTEEYVQSFDSHAAGMREPNSGQIHGGRAILYHHNGSQQGNSASTQSMLPSPSTEIARRPPPTTVSHPLYNAGSGRQEIQMPLDHGVQPLVHRHHQSHHPALSGPRELKKKRSILERVGRFGSNKGPETPLSHFQTLHEPTALTPERVFHMNYPGVYSQPGSFSMPIMTETSSSHYDMDTPTTEGMADAKFVPEEFSSDQLDPWDPGNWPHAQNLLR